MPVHRIPDARIPLPDPVVKPVRIEGGNIGSSANAQYHRESVYRFAALRRRHPRLRRAVRIACPVFRRAAPDRASRCANGWHRACAGNGRTTPSPSPPHTTGASTPDPPPRSRADRRSDTPGGRRKPSRSVRRSAACRPANNASAV